MGFLDKNWAPFYYMGEVKNAYCKTMIYSCKANNYSFLCSQVITEITETVSTDFTGPKTATHVVEREKPSGGDAAAPVRKKTIRTKVDSSKFLTPYLQHSNKMKDLFSEVICHISLISWGTTTLKVFNRYSCKPSCYCVVSCTSFHDVY